ncbi:MAG: twin-arginine translocation signal domain-containing protein [Microthrixaceae bacterium]
MVNINRRGFLVGTAGMAGAGLVAAACTDGGESAGGDGGAAGGGAATPLVAPGSPG